MGEATSLANLAREATEKQVAIVRELNVLTTKICNAREEIRSEVHAEIEAGQGKTTTRKIVVEDVPPVGPATSMDKYTTTKPTHVTADGGLEVERKRKCGLCHTNIPKPHRAKNCPNAHVIQDQKKQAAAEPAKKRKRNLTDEQRKALADRLVKARAAKSKKKGTK